MGVLSIDHVNHYPALLEARRDGSSDVSKVLASCDPRTPNALSVQLATLWTTTTLSLPELERLLRVPSRQVILAGDPGRGAIYLPTEQATGLLKWMHELDRERTHPPANRELPPSVQPGKNHS
jgi:hypothetical protein